MNGDKLERLIGWAHPVLLQRLKYRNTTIFIDGTFRSVPSRFYRCVVIMVHDAASDFFLPVFYILCSAKTQDMYWNAISCVISATDDKLQPETVVCDFEAALHDVVHIQFQDDPQPRVVGCYFHFKQACRRKNEEAGHL